MLRHLSFMSKARGAPFSPPGLANSVHDLLLQETMIPFFEALIDARARLPLDILGYGLMPNQFHLVIRPQGDGDLGRWVQ